MSKSTPRTVASSAAFCASMPAQSPLGSLNENGGDTPMAQTRTPACLIRSMVGDDTSQACATALATWVVTGGGSYLPVPAFPEASSCRAPPHPASSTVRSVSAHSTIADSALLDAWWSGTDGLAYASERLK